MPLPTRPTMPPTSGSVVTLIDVDSDGMTADGVKLTGLNMTEPFRNHARFEHVIARYPDGRLELAVRVVPARQAV